MSRKAIRNMTLLLAAAFIVAVSIYNIERMADHSKSIQQIPQPQESQSPNVAVVEVAAATHQAYVEGVGSVEARFDLALNSRVSGQVKTVLDDFESGRLVTSGSLLATLEDSEFRASLESARETLANARVSYLEEQQELQQAQQEWTSSGLTGEPTSSLVLREPQLAAAEAALESARKAVAAAEENLDSTQVKAPFDAIVVSRDIAPGSYIQAGNEIGHLLSADMVEISIPLSASNWSILADEAEFLSGDYSVELRQTETGESWTGDVARVEKNLNVNTRQRSLIVKIEDPLSQETPLYPGTFLKARIPGRAVEGLWRLPASALSQRGEIWIVTEDNLLQAHDANTRFSDPEYIYVVPPDGYREAHVLVQPLSSYSEGMKVVPQRELTNE
ncbi:efflux RND transporter periplasmic adaptor subunit [Billgrantia montanilacus]|uniref:Efflux RND transporter periplasmic adaptor subunit n=1 Tax=Billgrantia montanilacus TaxID=2282305 RepID=A0A368TW48_9GAMM|nr:efflux RND transporter periplasmic adaptor subunit [Halomonas montanilacus]RCV88811.1 efflux RND transporter periplasmic adaptor subunit [Halomonas montanilacus]